MILNVTTSLLALAMAEASPSDRLADASEGEDGPVIIVTAGHLPNGATDVLDRPGGTDLVLADSYKDKVAVSLRDALEFSPGVLARRLRPTQIWPGNTAVYPRFGHQPQFSCARAFTPAGRRSDQSG